MAYEKPITIKEAIFSIEDQEFVLPSIQREFVWGVKQMETLFDSLMRDYPISTFLFWKIKAENIKKFKFYSFLKNYHERDSKYTDEATFSGRKDVFGILDGQQRLTSLYVGLKGSHASRMRYYKQKSDHAYPSKFLYLNLFEKADNIEKEFDFCFLTQNEAAKNANNAYWYKVGNILKFDDISDAYEEIMDKIDDFEETLEEPLSRDTKKFARKTINKLFKVICENETINFFLEKDEELDKVLQIFIRINSGGTKLSYSDLLLSIATAQWKDLDARKVIREFVENINGIGKGFNFNKDLVLKSCLVLADINDIKFKVDNFSMENMLKIEEEWDDISSAITIAVKLAAHFGFDGKTLTATNAIIPIAYYIKDKKIGESVLHSSASLPLRKKIKEWLLRALLKKVFGGTPDSLYPVYRRIIKESEFDFPLEALIKRYSGTNKSLEFYKEDVDNLLNVQYGSPFAFMVLSLLYPLNHDYEFHQDHIHPRSFFTNKKLTKLGIESEELRQEYIQRFNFLPNIQLLQATENYEKHDKPLEDWLNEYYKNPEDLASFKQINLFPEGRSVSFDNFVSFYEARKQIIFDKLSKALNVQKEEQKIEE